MPRRRVAQRTGPALRTHTEQIVTKADGAWYVRQIRGSGAGKDYRCPGCAQVIRPVTAHLVAWPVQKALLSEAAIDERRHWHTACWARKH
ncbi:hypothetical protein [Aeromicrobium sp.]|uniref:hypothetical protein n=1 Tax=Aeromicrobium sp. TaxID=1871063 RepID=UPI0030C00199